MNLTEQTKGRFRAEKTCAVLLPSSISRTSTEAVRSPCRSYCWITSVAKKKQNPLKAQKQKMHFERTLSSELMVTYSVLKDNEKGNFFLRAHSKTAGLQLPLTEISSKNNFPNCASKNRKFASVRTPNFPSFTFLLFFFF